MEKISWTNHVRNEEVLLRVKERRNILHEISKRKANWIGHILSKNCLLRQVIEGKIKGGIEVTGRRGRSCRKLLDDLREGRGSLHLKEEALDRTMRRAALQEALDLSWDRMLNEWMYNLHVWQRAAGDTRFRRLCGSQSQSECLGRRQHVLPYTDNRTPIHPSFP
jgi:hypothetical protein